MLVIDTFRNLHLLSGYIYDVIRPQLQINDVKVFGWEKWVAEHTFTFHLAGPFLVVLGLEFLGPPITILIYTVEYHFNHLDVQVSTLQRWLWWTGTVLTGVLILYAIGYAVYSFGIIGPKKTRRAAAAEQAVGRQDA